MKKAIVMPVAGLVLAGLSVTATAEDLEGRIEAIDAASQTFTVQGVTFQATDQTDYDDGLRQFSDLKVDQRGGSGFPVPRWPAHRHRSGARRGTSLTDPLCRSRLSDGDAPGMAVNRYPAGGSCSPNASANPRNARAGPPPCENVRHP